MRNGSCVLNKRWVSDYLTPNGDDLSSSEQLPFLTYIPLASVVDLNDPIKAQWQGVYALVLDAVNHAPLQAKSNIERP